MQHAGSRRPLIHQEGGGGIRTSSNTYGTSPGCTRTYNVHGNGTMSSSSSSSTRWSRQFWAAVAKHRLVYFRNKEVVNGEIFNTLIYYAVIVCLIHFLSQTSQTAARGFFPIDTVSVGSRVLPTEGGEVGAPQSRGDQTRAEETRPRQKDGNRNGTRARASFAPPLPPLQEMPFMLLRTLYSHNPTPLPNSHRFPL